MKKKLLFAATVAAMLASCSGDNLSVQTAKQEAAGVENAVSFEAYSQRSLTRAGYAGVLDNDKLKSEGFGVFAYYTDNDDYDGNTIPNFMYNQKVSGAGWTYSPIKYWPNEYGNKAQSDDVDKLSFFAYAPYTDNTPATGKVAEDQVGITGFTRNTAAGDPYVKYVGSLEPTKCVDLCWGVADPNQDVTWDIINGGSQTMPKGMPWLNVQRPQKSLGQKMKFVFKHALSQLNVQIDADVNTNEHGQGSEVNFNTKVYVRSVTFNGFAMKGALNLNNEEAGTPNWKGYNCSNEPLQSEEYTIYDGMKDGKEGTGYTASNEKVTGLNEKIIQDKKWGEAAEGVTKTAKNLFNGDVDAPIYVIPTGDDMNVTIVYDIETKDAYLAGTVSDLETAGVSVENRISKTITVTGGTEALKLEAGKKYTINLHLGLSQVEFDAVVSDWDDTAAAGEAGLPGNGTVVSDITAMKPDALSSNPLLKVAQYNVAEGGTSFVSSHSTESQYIFSWADAKITSISGYHLPTLAEQVKIIPSTSATGTGTNWFNSAVSSTPAPMNSITGAGNTQEKGFYIKPSAKNDVYAVRIVGGVLTAWHYQWVTSPCSGLQIDSYVLAYQHTGAGDTWTDAEMQAILADLPSSSVWTTAEANVKPESSSSESSLVTRFLPACGRATSGSGGATAFGGTNGFYWSATANGESAFHWNLGSSSLFERKTAQGYGHSVRLFHD